MDKNSENQTENQVFGSKVKSENLLINQLENYLSAIYDFRFNEVDKATEYSPKGKNKFKEIGQRELSDIKIELQKAGVSKGFKEPLSDLLQSSEFAPNFNPFNDYFENLSPWDKTTEPDYIKTLCRCIKVKGNEDEQLWFERMFKKHLLRTIACSLRLIDFNKQCFVFLSEQNIGKTYFFRFLCPPTLKEKYYKENPPLDHKDSVIALSQNLLINLDELHSLDKSDANKVKSLFSQSDTKVRNHYATKDSIQSRYASFVASTNEVEFLNDVTGNVRWIVSEVVNIEFGYSNAIDINNVWRQAMSLVKKGEYGQLTKDEVCTIEGKNKFFQRTTPEIDLVKKHLYQTNVKDRYHFKVNATDILEAFTELTNGRIRINSIQLGKALINEGFSKKSFRQGSSKNPINRFIVGTTNQELSKIFEKQVDYNTPANELKEAF